MQPRKDPVGFFFSLVAKIVITAWIPNILVYDSPKHS